jgi:hypothetical protein
MGRELVMQIQMQIKKLVYGDHAEFNKAIEILVKMLDKLEAR